MTVPVTSCTLHAAIVEKVELFKAERDSLPTEIEITFRSLNTPDSFPLRFWVPNQFIKHLAQGSQMMPKRIFSGYEKQEVQFRKFFANRRKDAWLQRLVLNNPSVASVDGRDSRILPVNPHPQNIDEWVGNISLMLTGVQCLLSIQKGQIYSAYPKDDQQMRPEYFDRFQFAWEEQRPVETE